MAKKRVLYIALGLGVLVVLMSLVPGVYFYKYYGKIYPGVKVDGVPVSGLTINEASTKLSGIKIPEVLSLTTMVEGNAQTYTLPTSSFSASIDRNGAAQKAYRVGRSGNILSDVSQFFNVNNSSHSVRLPIDYDREKLLENLGTITTQVEVEAVQPAIKANGSEVVVDTGKPGLTVDTESLANRVVESLASQDTSVISFSAVPIDPSLSAEAAEAALLRGRAIVSKTLTISFEFGKKDLTGSELLSFVNPRGGYDQDSMRDWVSQYAKEINREPQNPTFVFQDGKVQEFAPAKNGVLVKEEQLVLEINQALARIESEDVSNVSMETPVVATEPQLTTSDVNNMGVKELIGRGESTFRGSIASRVHNVALAANRMNGTLVAPGETFSFNGALGDVSKFTGFKEAYVIQNGKTVLGDGGGVCQVSTTLFRAVLNAGLPIVARSAHSYRVGYYEQGYPPGLDATVYSPTTDFKFQNDTPGHILIQAYPDTTNLHLTFELYGTSDGRVATTTKPVLYDSTPPPEDLYVDDPTLPAGEIKQIEHKAWGAKVKFDYTVTRNGDTLINKTFYSNYRPWQAVFLKGTGPAATS